MRRITVAALLLALILAPGLIAQERFSNATAGISLSPPAGWAVVSMQEVMQNRAKVRLSDSELQAGLQRATAPLFVFAKYPEPHPTLNPTLQVVLRPSPAAAGTPALAGRHRLCRPRAPGSHARRYPRFPAGAARDSAEPATACGTRGGA